ncbi:hypothetical protein SNE40_011708 [Patella caerulea]|uniref:Fibrinogen C-terminal domain-containing protein n=1 Tax=Patella caerulea TaxID=87958 RepID=A0AAN8JNX6_PATCE
MWGSTICKEVSFNLTSNEYVMGFSIIHGEYWLGLENLFNILQNLPTSQSHYHDCDIGNGSDSSTVSISGFDGGATGDSLTNGTYSINDRAFSTYDRDHTNHNCPGRFHGGWWYLDNPVRSEANIFGRRSGDTFESTCHLQDDLGLEPNFTTI